MSDDAGGSGEFHRIATYFAPLARGADASLGLTDDAALLSVPAGMELAVTADTLVESVHFIGDEPADELAQKCLRVNLSDLAAMGAQPYGYFLSLSLPNRIDDAWVAAFCQGLGRDQSEFDWHLLGGDSTSTPGPMSIAVTAMGLVEKGRAMRRSGAKPGDAVFVSGTIGDGFLGLLAVRGQLPYGPEADAVRRRYNVPDPRISLGRSLAGVAHSAMDVSDGLVADLTHICAASGVGADIDARAVPVSSAAAELLAGAPDLFPDILTGGDDYELLVTGPEEAVLSAAASSGTRLTRIGAIRSGAGVSVLDGDGQVLQFVKTGFRHG
ncbi:MAG: thiamine-phosphate kinase [Pseudomonadota bacterium]|nr:thiamine-phosphate kinase [Pseudomonadota bacterium]